MSSLHLSLCSSAVECLNEVNVLYRLFTFSFVLMILYYIFYLPPFPSFYPSHNLNIDDLPCGDASNSLYSGVQKKPVVCPMDSLASALRDQLTYDRDSDSLTTSPSSSSLDTCSSQKIFQAFSKSCRSPIHQETSAGEVREAGDGSGSSFSEAEGCHDEEPKIARSVTDGELRHRILSPLSHHGVSRGEQGRIVF